MNGIGRPSVLHDSDNGVAAARRTEPGMPTGANASFDVVIVGAGPAGLFATLRAGRGKASRVLMVDGGLDIAGRIDARLGRCDGDEVITSGLGGAGLFSDGKLCLSPRIGSTISHRFPPSAVEARQAWIDEAIRSGEDAPLHGADSPAVAGLVKFAATVGLEYLHYPIRHVGSDQLPSMLTRLRARISDGASISCQTRCLTVTESDRSERGWRLLLEAPGAGPFWIYADHVVLAPGKVGAAWMQEIGAALGLRQHPARPKLGFRLEGPKSCLDPLLSVAGDPKLIWKRPDGAEARTHCVCFGGDVVPAEYDRLLLVGGHSESTHRADRSNTAVIAAGGSTARLTAGQARDFVSALNARYGGLVAQSLDDFLRRTPSDRSVADMASGFVPSIPDAAPGDLSAALPRAVTDVLQGFLAKLGRLCPEAVRPNNILYGPAVERWSPRFAVSDEMETDREGLFLVGDGPGLTGGVIGAAETGWLAGDAIASRLSGASGHASKSS